jgi:hypothetical protein
MLILGSNNSLTYLEPSPWWFKIFKNIKKCQEVPYDEQYTFWGVRFFDFRLGVDKHNHIIAKNGIHEYPIFSFYEMLDYFDKRGDVILRVSFEETRHANESKERKFKEICKIIEFIYEDIHLVGGYRKFDNKKIYQFDWERKNKIADIINPSEWSPVYRFITKWFPSLIGALNTKYLKMFKDKKAILVLNYINKR